MLAAEQNGRILRMKWDRRDWFLLAAVVLLGAAFRLYKLGVVPPGFQFDEAFNAIDAAQVLAGNRPLFLPANAGREALYTYWQAAIAWLAGGITPYTLRLASAVAGTCSVAAAYLLVRTLFSRQSRTLALFTSLALAISLWNIHFSHFGIRVIMMPMLLSAAFGAYWSAGNQEKTNRRLLLYSLSGALVGVTVWTHPTGRLVPFVLMGHTLWQLLQMPTHKRALGTPLLRHPLAGLVMTGVVAFIVFLPLGLEFYRRPDFFLEHASEAFVFNAEVGGDAPWLALLQHLFQVLGMFNVRGDLDWTHNVPGRPVFDPVMSIPFLIGLLLWIRRMSSAQDPDRNALVLLALWVLVMLFPSILSNDAPDFSRTLPTHPALFITTGLGLSWLWNLARSSMPFIKSSPLMMSPLFMQRAGRAMAVLVVGVSGAWTFYDYFVKFPQRQELYYVYDVDKLDALRYLESLTQANQLYLSQLWAGHASVTFLRGEYGIRSLDTSDTIVLPPPGLGVVYAFPAEQDERAQEMAAALNVASIERTTDPYGKQLLSIVQADAQALGQWPNGLAPQQPMMAQFEDGPTLLGLSPNRFNGDGENAITLYWRADAPMLRDLTSFVHLIDMDGNRVGQVDKAPGNGSYRTPYWSPGERVIDVYHPKVSDPCAGGERVRVLVGWYELAANGLRRPRLDTFGDTALAGEMTLPVRAHARAERVPDVLLNQDTAAAANPVRLWGYTLHGAEFQAGAPVTLDLFWQKGEAQSGGDAPPTVDARLRLEGGGKRTNIWSGQVSAPRQWSQDEVVCQRLRLRLPNEITSGQYAFNLVTRSETSAPEVTSNLGSLTLQPSTRNYSLPASITPSGARFGHLAGQPEIALAGAQIGEQSVAENSLQVTLVWQVETPPQANYTAFLHLVDSQGQIISQSDAPPAGGYATGQWAPGEVIFDAHLLSLPENLPGGAYTLVAGLYDALSGQRLWAIDGTGQALPGNAAEITKVELY